MSTSFDDRARFVSDIDLGESPLVSAVQAFSSEGVAPSRSSSAGGSASVIAASCISFLPTLNGQLKEDVVASTLFAQIAATKQYDRETQARQWYGYYAHVLEIVGWTTESFTLTQIDGAEKYVSVDRLVLSLSEQHLSGDEAALFRAMIEALKKDDNKDAVALLDKWSLYGTNVAEFQAGVASNSNGNPKLKLSAYRVNATERIDSALFFHFGSKKVSFFSGEQEMTLNEEVYARLRQQIKEKLGGLDDKSRIMEIHL